MLAVIRCAVVIGHAPLPPAARAGRIGRSAKVRIKELHYAARRATSPRPPFCRAHRPPSADLFPHPFAASCRPAPHPPLRLTPPHLHHPIPFHTLSRQLLHLPPSRSITLPIHHTTFVRTRPQLYPHATIPATAPAAARPTHAPRTPRARPAHKKNPEWLRSPRNHSGS